jgi:hypothetical protein
MYHQRIDYPPTRAGRPGGAGEQTRRGPGWHGSMTPGPGSDHDGTAEAAAEDGRARADGGGARQVNREVAARRVAGACLRRGAGGRGGAGPAPRSRTVGVEEAELSITLLDDAAWRALNREWKGGRGAHRRAGVRAPRRGRDAAHGRCVRRGGAGVRAGRRSWASRRSGSWPGWPSTAPSTCWAWTTPRRAGVESEMWQAPGAHTRASWGRNEGDGKLLRRRLIAGLIVIAPWASRSTSSTGSSGRSTGSSGTSSTTVIGFPIPGPRACSCCCCCWAWAGWPRRPWARRSWSGGTAPSTGSPW